MCPDVNTEVFDAAVKRLESPSVSTTGSFADTATGPRQAGDQGMNTGCVVTPNVLITRTTSEPASL